MSSNKSFSSETSERYSLALLELAKENSLQDQIEKQMKLLSTIYVENEDFQNFIKNPTNSISSQNEIMLKVSKILNLSGILQNFILLLIEKRRIFFLKKIIDTFLRLCSKDRGEIKAIFTSAEKLDKNKQENIHKDLSKTIGSSLKFEFKIDESLIGGSKIQLGSLMIDSSIKNKLAKYRTIMMEN